MKASLSAVGIGALVVANAVGVVAVNKHFRVTAEASTTAPAVATVSSSSLRPPSKAASTKGPRPAATAAVVDRSPGVFVIATNADHAWRAVNSGGCSGSVRVQETQDGGNVWTTLAKPPAGATNGIAIDGAGQLQLTGQSSTGCAPQTWSLASGAWTPSNAGGWVREGAPSADVTHDAQQQHVCRSGDVMDLATAGDNAFVLCSTGEVRKVSASGPATTAYRGSGLLSIATIKDNTLMVARSVKDCDGVELATVSGGSAQPVTCVNGASKAVDLTFAGDHGWLVAAHNTWTGTATGRWSKS